MKTNFQQEKFIDFKNIQFSDGSFSDLQINHDNFITDKEFEFNFDSLDASKLQIESYDFVTESIN